MESDQTHISVPQDVGQDEGAAVTGEKPLSPSQESHLKMLAAELGVPVDLNLTGREAMRKIDELERKAGRGGPKDS